MDRDGLGCLSFLNLPHWDRVIIEQPWNELGISNCFRAATQFLMVLIGHFAHIEGLRGECAGCGKMKAGAKVLPDGAPLDAEHAC